MQQSHFIMVWKKKQKISWFHVDVTLVEYMSNLGPEIQIQFLALPLFEFTDGVMYM